MTKRSKNVGKLRFLPFPPYEWPSRVTVHFWIFLQWIALEKLHGRRQSRAIEKLGLTPRQSSERCRVTKNTIFQQCRTLFHRERQDQYPRPHQIWNQRIKLSTISVLGGFFNEFHFSTKVEPYSPTGIDRKSKTRKTLIQRIKTICTRWKYMDNAEWKHKGYLNPSFVDFYFRSIPVGEYGSTLVEKWNSLEKPPTTEVVLSFLRWFQIWWGRGYWSCLSRWKRVRHCWKIVFFVTRHLSQLWRSVRSSFYIARMWLLSCSFSRAIHWRNIQKCTVTLDGHSYGGNGKNLSFPTFFDLLVIRPRFLNVCFATEVVDLEKLHRKVNFLKCLDPIPDGDSFREIVL